MRRFLNLVGGVRFTLILLGSALLFVVAGTLIEGLTDSHENAQTFAYRHPLFLLILSCFFLNILTAALRRWPFKGRHLPFLIAHLGLLLILSGVMLKALVGTQGVMLLVEGSGSDELLIPAKKALSVSARDGSQWSVPLSGMCGSLTIECLKLLPHGEARLEGWVKGNSILIEGLPPLPLDGSARKALRLASGAIYELVGAEGEDASGLLPQVTVSRDADGVDHLTVKQPGKPPEHTAYAYADLEAIICRDAGFGGYALWHDVEGGRLTCPLTLQLRPLPPPLKAEDRRPIATLRLLEGGREEILRLLYDPTASALCWPALSGHYLLRFQPKVQKLPYRVRLRDARRTDHPLTHLPASFTCDLLITDLSGREVETTLSMNRVYETPDGYRLYLSGISDDVETSPARVTLAISRDPTRRLLTYPGGALVAIGTLLLYRRKRYHAKPDV